MYGGQLKRRKINMAVEWDYYDKFEELMDKYLPMRGEGETKATQIVTAVSKLVYKWYNDGDVFDNTYNLTGWANDLSDYANWLYEYTDTDSILASIIACYNESDYEDLLKKLADKLLDEDFLAEQNKMEKMESIYKCDGIFKYEECYEEEEDDDYYEDDEEEEDY
jgi:hypothetical protein